MPVLFSINSVLVPMNSVLAKKFATLGKLGYLPAPGTWGSLAGVALVLLVGDTFLYPLLVGALFGGAWYTIAVALQAMPENDPSIIVLDELVGCLITFLWLPISIRTVTVGFCLFRFFDIAKRFGVGWCEQLPGAQGVLFDDCWAGVLSGAIVQLLLYYGLL